MKTQRGLQVPETNKASLGLYVTAQKAYAMWKADPARVNIIDVRTFEEYTFVGHLEMARNIPFVFPRYKPPTDEEAQSAPAPGGRHPGCYEETNLEFVSTVKSLYKPTNTILICCATGGRGDMAVN